MGLFDGGNFEDPDDPFGGVDFGLNGAQNFLPLPASTQVASKAAPASGQSPGFSGVPGITDPVDPGLFGPGVGSDGVIQFGSAPSSSKAQAPSSGSASTSAPASADFDPFDPGIFDPGNFSTGAIGAAGEAGLSGIIRSKGFDQGIFDATAKSLRETFEREFDASIEIGQEFLAGRGITGGGTEGSLITELRGTLAADMATKLRDTATALGIDAANRSLSASQSAVMAGLEQRAQDIGLAQIKVATALDKIGLGIQQQGVSNSFALGQGRLALDNLALNMSFTQGLIDAGIDVAALQVQLELGAIGAESNASQLLAQIAGQISGGFVG